MPPKRSSENCGNEHCEEHSGLLTWMKGIAVLLTAATGLLSYSVFWQAPNIRVEIVKEVARLDQKDRDLENALKGLCTDVSGLKDHVTKLEAKK